MQPLNAFPWIWTCFAPLFAAVMVLLAAIIAGFGSVIGLLFLKAKRPPLDGVGVRSRRAF